MERLLNRELNVSLTPDSKAYLKRLMLRPNPEMAEFAFLGLGKGNLVDQIIADEKKSEGKYRLSPNGRPIFYVSKAEIAQLLLRLESSGRKDDFLILGHLHPIGIRKINGERYILEPRETLLIPSVGTEEEGGLTAAHDVGFLKDFYERIVNVPYAGIAARTGYFTSKLRIYKIEELIKIKDEGDINKVPQATITL